MVMISEKRLFSYYLTLNRKVLRSSETSVTIYQSTRRHIPEEVNLNQLFLLFDSAQLARASSLPGLHDLTLTNHTQ
jgi:hypothetical protein